MKLPGGAHLDRATRAEELALGEEVTLEALAGGEAGAADQGGLADVVKHRVENLLLG